MCFYPNLTVVMIAGFDCGFMEIKRMEGIVNE